MDDLIQVERELFPRHLHSYVQAAWPLVEPATQFVDNWHIGLICDYLTAVTNGDIRNLIINIPPRFMKSLLVCVFWPTWTWTHSPAKRWLFASYSDEIAIRDALKSRRIIQSPWYQERWGHMFKMAGDQNVKSRYENDQSGFRMSVGVGGSGTGEGGEFIVSDDPHKAKDADSDAALATASAWWDGTMSTRGNDPKTAARVIIMQRLHERDLTGHVLTRMSEDPDAPRYEHLVLPMEHEPGRFVSTIGKQDPRKEKGELLWPGRFGPAEVATLKAALGERGTAGQLQQRPAPAGGAIFLRDWWLGKNRYDARDRSHFIKSVGRWLSFDTAFKDEEKNDFTAMTVFELTPDYRLMTRQVEWRKLQFPQLSKEIEDQARRWNYDKKLRGVIVEDKGSGTSALQTLRQASADNIADLLIPFMPQGSKEYRARQASLWCERGCVLLPEQNEAAPWLYDFEEEHLYKFPASSFDDPEDSFVQGIFFAEHLLSEGWRMRAGIGQ